MPKEGMWFRPKMVPKQTWRMMVSEMSMARSSAAWPLTVCRVSGEAACTVEVFQETTGADVRRQVRELLPEELYRKCFRLLLGMTEFKGETTLLELGATETVTLTMALSPGLFAFTAYRPDHQNEEAQLLDLFSPEVLCNFNVEQHYAPYVYWSDRNLSFSHDGGIVAVTTQDYHFLFSTDSGKCLHNFDYYWKFGTLTNSTLPPTGHSH